MISFWWTVPAFFLGAVFGIMLLALVMSHDDKDK